MCIWCVRNWEAYLLLHLDVVDTDAVNAWNMSFDSW